MPTQYLCCYCLQLPYINEAETVSLSINVLSNGNSLPCNKNDTTSLFRCSSNCREHRTWWVTHIGLCFFFFYKEWTFVTPLSQIISIHGFVFVVCDNGWLPYNNHCYWLSPSPVTFHNAVVRIKCVNTCVIVDMKLRQHLLLN